MERDFTIKIQTEFINPYTLLFFTLNLVVIVLLLIFRKRTKHFPLIVFSYIAFYLSFLPVSGVFLINGIFYEHFLYLPLVFFASFWLFLLGKKLKSWILVVFIVYLAGLSARTMSRQLEWIDPIRFYTQTLSHAPESIRIRNGLGMAYADKGELDQAIGVYQDAITLNPNIPQSLSQSW